MKSFLLIGQSNMAGRGDFGEVSEIINEKCFMLRNGRWHPMREPINPDRAIFDYFHSGRGLSASFADEYAKHFNENIGLIPCADGGTSLSEWMPGKILYDNAVNNAKLAQRTSELTGILWHQGESDCAPELSETYCQRLQTMMAQLRQDLGIPDLPILVGGLGDYLTGCERFPEVANYRAMNLQLQKFAAEDIRCEFVDATGLEGKPDCLHFTAAAQEEFGKRYFAAWQKLDVPITGDGEDTPVTAGNSAMETL